MSLVNWAVARTSIFRQAKYAEEGAVLQAIDAHREAEKQKRAAEESEKARAELRQQLRDKHADALHLQDLLDQERSEKDWLREQLVEVTKSKEDILKMQVNICYQEKYGFRLYLETGGLPDDFVEARTKQQQASPSRPARADGHAVAAKATASFLENYELRKKQNEALETKIREAAKANNPVVVASN